MAEPITITVDGREIACREGQMLVDAAKGGDVEIPVFCYEPKLGPPVGACRMCLVEIEGIPKLQTACSTPVRDGMVVYTRNEQVKEAQNAVVEFLLVNHPLDCPVCDKGGECPLQDIAMGWGTGKSRVIEPKRHFEKPVALSPLVAIDRERCIMCYRCVRFSQEVSEDAQLQLLRRGADTYVGTFDDRPYIAPFHGNITELCPVGALTSYTYRFRARPWDIEQAGSVCTGCPSQCNVSFTVRDDSVKRVLARDNDEVDDGWICDRGRYGFEMWSGPDRITAPMVRDGGALRPASWGEALDRAAAGLESTGGATAALVGDASNEEGFLLQRLLREALGSGDIDSRLGAGPTRNQLARLADPAISARTKDLDNADAILVLGVDPLNAAPVIDLRVRKAVRRNGAKLVVATDRPTALDGGSLAGARYAVNHGGVWTNALTRFLAADMAPRMPGREAEDMRLDETRNPESAPSVIDSSASIPEGEPSEVVPAGVADVAEILQQAESIVVLWGERLAREPGGVDAVIGLAEALGLAGRDGSGLIGIPDTGNGRGLREVGVLPDAGPGLSDLAAGGPTPPGRGAEEIRAALTEDQLKGLIVFGTDPVRDGVDAGAWRKALAASEFTVAFAMHASETTATADVIFPLESSAEKEGTVTHMDGRLQRVRPNARRPGDVRAVWQVLTELNAMLGNETGIGSAPEALAAVSDSVPFYSGITAEEIGGRGVRWQEREIVSNPETGGDIGAALWDATPSSNDADVPGADGSVALSVPEGNPDIPTQDQDQPSNGLLLGTYRDLWAGPVTEHNPALHFLKAHQRVELAPEDAKRLGLEQGDHVEVSQNGDTVAARVLVRERMLAGAAFLIEGTAENNANRLSRETPQVVEIRKVTPPVELEVQKVAAS